MQWYIEIAKNIANENNQCKVLSLDKKTFYSTLLFSSLLLSARRDLFQSLQCISRIQMFGKTEIHNFNVWKSQNTEFHSLEKPQLRIPMFGKAKTLNSNVWKVKIQNSDVWKS